MAAITINTNLASLTAQRNLTAATNSMNRSMERLTTGYRINSGKDDAAGSSVSNLMEAQISAYDVAEGNTTMGLSLLDTAEGILDIVGSYVQRIRDLTEQAANGTYGTASLQAIRTEVQQRMLEINRLCDVIDFNGIKLLDGTSIPAQTEAGINLQVGNNTGTENVINLDYTLFLSAKITALLISGNVNSKSGYGNPTDTDWAERKVGEENGITGALLARLNNDTATYGNATYDYSDTDKYFSILDKEYDPTNMNEVKTGINSCITAICDAVYTDDATARDFLCFLDDAIDNISARTALIGAYMNRVESAVDAIGVQKENIVSANSSIKDADVAEESSSYIKYQILQQSTATLLSTANQLPQIALNLI